jgi:thiol-disulfide isomerase/thioredoxin
MFRIRIFLLFVLIWLSGILTAQERIIRISGQAVGFAGETIRFIHYSDRITFQEEALAAGIIGEDGKFSLQFPSKSILSGKLSIGFQGADLIVMPDSPLDIIIQDSSINHLQTPSNPFIQAKPLKMILAESGNLRLNRQTDSLQNLIDLALLDTNKQINTQYLRTRFQKLQKTLETALQDSLNPYLQTYARYSLAPLDALANRLDEPRVWKKYFKNGEIQYEHPVYMQFFNDFFDHYPGRRSQFITQNDLEHCINRLGSYTALMDSLGKDSLLVNERLRELVMMKSLSEYYYTDGFSKDNIVKILTHIVFNSKFREHRTTALNLKTSFTAMTAGERLPDFRLKNLQAKWIQPDSEPGIPVYYSFVTTWCEDCVSELMVVAKLHEKYKGKVRFVTVLCNGNAAVAAGFLRQHPDWRWEFLLLDKDIEVLKEYKVRSFPTFLLAGRGAEVLRYPAPSPSQGIEKFIDRWLSEKN